MQLNVMCNLSYVTTQICNCMCRMQLNFSCKQQLQNPKFLIVKREANYEFPPWDYVPYKDQSENYFMIVKKLSGEGF